MKLKAEAAGSFHCPRYAELPGIQLYMDQVLLVVNDALSPVTAEEDRLTPAMVNNYVKQRVVEPPVKKKYGKAHVAALIMVTAFKRVLPILQVKRLLCLLGEGRTGEERYDLFCQTLESTLQRAALSAGDLAPAPDAGLRAMRAALTAFVGKCYAESIMEEAGPEDLPEPEEPKKKKPRRNPSGEKEKEEST